MDGAAPDAAGDIDEAVKERAMDEAPVGITLTDPSRPDNPLVYVNESFVEMTGYDREDVIGRNCRFLQGPESSEAAVAEMREAIDAERPVSVELVNYRADGSAFWNEVSIAPIRDASGEVTHFVGFQSDVTARKEAELAVERERENLAHLVDRINGLMQDVTAELVGATGREEIDRTLAERVAATDPYVAAWVGSVDIGGDRVETAARDGSVPEMAIRLGGGDPVARAVEAREPLVVAAADLPEGSPHREVGGAVAAVPLVYRETLYGVLAVYADGVDAFDDRETVVLAALARAAATAANAVESRRMLAGDEVVELELLVADPDCFFVALSEWWELEYGGSVPRSDGTTLLFFTVRGEDVGKVGERASDLPNVEAADVVIERDDGALVEFTVTESLVDRLADRGARVRSVVAEGGTARVDVELPAGGDPRQLLADLRDRYDAVDLDAYRERERPARTREEFVDALDDRLTDQQSTALRKAYLSGYFDPDRPVTGDELAASMGISRSTFHQHLRAAERKLVGEFVGD